MRLLASEGRQDASRDCRCGNGRANGGVGAATVRRLRVGRCLRADEGAQHRRRRLERPPNGARICRWLGVDLDGGDPKGPDGVIDGGRAAILESTRQFNADGSATKKPFDHVTAAGDGAGFHHMHRLDLLMSLYTRVFEFGPDSGAQCPITVHMNCRLTQLRQTAAEVTATFSNGQSATGEVLVGADGINSATLRLAWPNPRPKRWTEVTCFRGLIPRTVVASLRKADGSSLNHNPINSFSMDRYRNDKSGATTYWVRGGELLNVWIARRSSHEVGPLRSRRAGNLGTGPHLLARGRGAPDASHVWPRRRAVLRGRRRAH